jgi:hypothetical protein
MNKNAPSHSSYSLLTGQLFLQFRSIRLVTALIANIFILPSSSSKKNSLTTDKMTKKFLHQELDLKYEDPSNEYRA